ncbi:AAA domain-containing protein [Streptomyces cremeus]|uniref:AAA domain-containing protein n=1 Tax=Streptomyces cremeus TaxID=66881 RepID=A0ABV5P5C3_STRCM
MSERGDAGGDEVWQVGATYAYGDGLQVRVEDVRPYRPNDPENLYDHRAGDDLVVCTLVLTNNSERSLNLVGLRLLVACGPQGRMARQFHEYDNAQLDPSHPEGHLRPGRTTSMRWGFSVPSGTGEQLDFEVVVPSRHGERPSVTFSTMPKAVPAPSATTAPSTQGPRVRTASDTASARHPAASPRSPDRAAQHVAAETVHRPAVPAPRPSSDRGTDLDARRVQQIFRFLAEAEETRVRPVRTLDTAAGTVWFDELPDDQGVAVMTEEALTDAHGGPAWLTVRRPRREEPPMPPRKLDPWVDTTFVRDFHQQVPPLKRRIEAEPAVSGTEALLDGTYTELDDHPDREKVEKRYEAWQYEWSAWAERRRAVEPLVRLYDKLHKMHEDAANLGETYELVLGIGRLTWQALDGQRVERHLFVHRAALQLDPVTGTLTAAPDPSTPGIQFEESMLDGEQRVKSDVREEIKHSLDIAADASEAEHIEALHRALHSWTNAVHSAAQYLPGIERERPRSLEVPQVCFAPALVLRERNRRSTLDALKFIADQVEQGREPTELLAYIAGRGGAQTVAELGADRPGRAPAEVFFALAANEEQRTIAERLHDNRLVVVQGPPGTGKTHTIANLVTDLLAQGKRVLITSHTPRALRVLRDKLPESVRDLCVSRTEDGAAAQRELESSVYTILSRYSGYDPTASQREVDTLQARLDAARAQQRQLLNDLAAVRNAETARYTAEIGDYRGSLQDIAERLAAERPQHEWLGPVPDEQSALEPASVLRLLHAVRGFTAHHRALAADVPGPTDLPTAGEFETAVTTVRAAEAAHAETARDTTARAYDGHVRRLTESAQQKLSEELHTFSAVRVRAGALAGPTGTWAREALGQAAAGLDWEIRSRQAEIAAALTAAQNCADAVGSVLVTGLEQFDPNIALGHATMLHDGLSQGQSLTGMFGRPSKLGKAVAPFVDAVKIDGRALTDQATAAVALARVQLELHLGRIEREWGRTGTPWQGHSSRLAALRQDFKILEALLAVADARADVLAAAATSPELAAAPWHEPAVEQAVHVLLRVATTLREADAARRLIADTEEFLHAWLDRPGASLAVGRARDAVRACNPEGYRAFCEELAEVREAVRLRAARQSAYDEVHDVLPDLARRIEDCPQDDAWDARLPMLHEAWAWSAWCARMERMTAPDAEQDLRQRLTVADDDARYTLAELATARAWHRCLGLLTGDQSLALSAYQHAVRKIKGKYQHRYRRDAQDALRDAQGAVPAWIMPLHQVAETVPLDRPGIFDVVIVDEASQSGLEAMLLSWLADRMVVVGDDKQVSPANVGLAQEEYFQLRDRLLPALTVTRRGLFGPDTSFFDLSRALSAGRGTLMLQEHFRCMPEIISFSNHLCYKDKLQPLRQYGADRLPPVRTVYVDGAEESGSGTRLVNKAEARALADAVAKCCADPAYAGLTMGVISLRSSKGHLTELENLLAELPYEDREERQIRVGKPEDFQGDERDVVFVSCVNSATTRSGTVQGGFNGKSYEQRLNVAASRAKDQVWIFHSVAVGQFHENDLRRKWLDHVGQPAEPEASATVPGEVLPDVRHESFDSLFQQQVYLELVGRGYRVRPRYKVGRHRIDLVVEGGTRRLAVACDGDAFAEGEDAGTAAARQRDLERVQWVFVRIRGSRFAFDREQALAPLWHELDRLGIEPERRGGPAVVQGEATGATERVAVHEEPAPVPSEQDGQSAEDEPAVGAGPCDPVEGQISLDLFEDLFGDPSVDEEEQLANTPLPGHGGVFPVPSVPVSVYTRLFAEIQQLESALHTDGPSAGGIPPEERRPRADRRERMRTHLDTLRAFVDEVSVDDEPPTVAVPGALLKLDFDGKADTETVYVLAEIAPDGTQALPPGLPLGAALMFQPLGVECVYESDGRARTVRVWSVQA